jgi:hypothetical protein
LEGLGRYLHRFAFVLAMVGATPHLITMISILSLATNNPLYPESVRVAVLLVYSVLFSVLVADGCIRSLL